MQSNLSYLLLLTLALSVQLSSLALPTYNYRYPRTGYPRLASRVMYSREDGLAPRQIDKSMYHEHATGFIQKRLAEKAKKKAAKAAKAVVKTAKKVVGKGKGVKTDDMWPKVRPEDPPPPPPPSTGIFINDLVTTKKRMVFQKRLVSKGKAAKEVVKHVVKKVLKKKKKDSLEDGLYKSGTSNLGFVFRKRLVSKGKAAKEVAKAVAKKVVSKVHKKKSPWESGLYKSGASNLGFPLRKRLVLKATKKAMKAVVNKVKPKKKTAEELEEEKKKKEEAKYVKVDEIFPQGGGGRGWNHGGTQ